MTEDSHLRIGELSRRSGVSPELLRAWERRYGLLRPERSPGGLRLYSLDDLERVRLMSRHIAAGVAAREAAELAARAELGPGVQPSGAALDPQAARERLARAVARFDEPAAQALLDELLAGATIDALLAGVVLPYLRELGDAWARGDVTVAEEHFASNVLRGRLLGLARGWGRGGGPRALLACPEGEHHDLGLIAFGLALRGQGWRIDFLGANTPTDSILGAARALAPQLLVVSAAAPDLLSPVVPALRPLARELRVALAGEGARGLAGASSDLLALTGDPVSEARSVTELVG